MGDQVALAAVEPEGEPPEEPEHLVKVMLVVTAYRQPVEVAAVAGKTLLVVLQPVVMGQTVARV
jgi:hypothetical protein